MVSCHLKLRTNMRRKPVIGITKPDNKQLFAYLAITAGVIIAGGTPLKITPKDKKYESHNVDGLILGGGKDIFPGHYNQLPKEDYIYDSDRDDMEIFWAERAREENIPTLGICRGAQLMNVICGGTLHANVSEAYEDANYPDGFIHHAFFRKKITIYPDTPLYQILGTEKIKVNSLHKQAIDKLGKKLNIDAIEPNGVVQGISSDNHDYFIGLQFHPEFLIYKRKFRQIFESLIKKASDN